MQIKLLDMSSSKASEVQFSDVVFADKYREDLIHQAVQAYRAGGRAGTKAQKTRSEVSGGGAKPWRQKGTGNARAGTIRSPIFRGGGVTFAAKNRDYSQKLNKKMYLVAMRSILSELVRQDRLLVIENLTATGKTKDLAKKMDELNLGRVLIVTDDVDANLYLAARNLKTVDVCDVKEINPVELISFEKVLFSMPALRKVEEKLS